MQKDKDPLMYIKSINSHKNVELPKRFRGLNDRIVSFQAMNGLLMRDTVEVIGLSGSWFSQKVNQGVYSVPNHGLDNVSNLQFDVSARQA